MSKQQSPEIENCSIKSKYTHASKTRFEAKHDTYSKTCMLFWSPFFNTKCMGAPNMSSYRSNFSVEKNSMAKLYESIS